MITVFGLGFVGLTTALGFANFGYKVYGVDIDEERKNLIRQKRIPFLEEGLDTALANHLGRNFTVEDNIKKAIENSEFIFYCVGTPYGESGEADLNYLFAALDETLISFSKDKKYILVTKSTIPPGTTLEKVIPYIEQKGYKVGQEILVANNPEFLREGHCWRDFIYADRIVVGCNDVEGIERLKELYKPFCIPFYGVSYNTGEFIKYISNAILATMISFSNEMAIIADAIGNVDIKQAFQILHMDNRWNNCNMTTYVYPGCGYGGYCLPKDTNALYAVSKQKAVEAKILKSVIEMNNNMPEYIVKKITKRISKNDRIGVLGLSFKPGSNDVRDSVSAKIIMNLIKKGFKNILAYDPVAIKEFEDYYSVNINYSTNIEEFVIEADIIIILTAWEEFRIVKESYPEKVIDFRYM